MFNRKSLLFKYGFGSVLQLSRKTEISYSRLNEFINEKNFHLEKENSLKLNKIIPLYEFYIERD